MFRECPHYRCGQGQVQDFTAIEMERIPQRPPETVVFKMAQVSGGHFW